MNAAESDDGSERLVYVQRFRRIRVIDAMVALLDRPFLNRGGRTLSGSHE